MCYYVVGYQSEKYWYLLLMPLGGIDAAYDNDNDNDKQFVFRHVCPYNIKSDIHYAQC